MRILRLLGNISLWLGAFLGVIAGGVWFAGQMGWIQPLIVVSGSMEPGIDTGDLLIDRPLATADVEPGDVLSLHSEMTGKLVTHRVTEITPLDDGTWEVRMKGDANDQPDLETYIVGDSVISPAFQIPQGGKVVSKMMEPAVAMPILLALIALLGLSLLDEPRRTIVRVKRPDSDARDSLDELDEALAALGIDVADYPSSPGSGGDLTWPSGTKTPAHITAPVRTTEPARIDTASALIEAAAHVDAPAFADTVTRTDTAARTDRRTRSNTPSSARRVSFERTATPRRAATSKRTTTVARVPVGAVASG